MEVNWHEYDYKNKAETAPSGQTLVWINEVYYYDVTVGYFDGNTFRVWNGSDDCKITHWAEIDWPEALIVPLA